MQIGAATVQNSVEITQIIKNVSAFWPCGPTSGNISKVSQNTNLKEHKHPCVHYYNCQDIEAAQASISRWVDKTTMGYLLNGILLSHKKKKSLPFVTVWVGLENIMLSATSQSEKEIRISFHSYVESKEQGEVTSKIETDS